MTISHRNGDAIVLPGIASAHSHAFQRGLRATAQRRNGSFWSWRDAMYALAAKMTPDDIRDLSRLAFVELASCGVTAVGEFHYVHHQPDGTPYSSRTELADAVIEAARFAGIRITLLRVVYERAGLGRDLEGAQRRFVDASLEDALSDVASLARHADPRTRIGIAPHSVRAVRIESIEEAARFAREHGLPMHMHVSEQEREVRECLAEHGVRPLELLAARGVIDERFCAVHATHVAPHEITALARSFVCLCRTTERDLGDGLPPLRDLLRAGARLCFGADSHALSDPFEEARAAELDERSRTKTRCATDATVLLNAMSSGYDAIGMAGASEDRVVLDGNTMELAGTRRDDDAIVFAASARSVREVWVAGERIVEDGHHVRYDEARIAYEAALGRLMA